MRSGEAVGLNKFMLLPTPFRTSTIINIVLFCLFVFIIFTCLKQSQYQYQAISK